MIYTVLHFLYHHGCYILLASWVEVDAFSTAFPPKFPGLCFTLLPFFVLANQTVSSHSFQMIFKCNLNPTQTLSNHPYPIASPVCFLQAYPLSSILFPFHVSLILRALCLGAIRSFLRVRSLSSLPQADSIKLVNDFHPNLDKTWNFKLTSTPSLIAGHPIPHSYTRAAGGFRVLLAVTFPPSFAIPLEYISLYLSDALAMHFPVLCTVHLLICSPELYCVI